MNLWKPKYCPDGRLVEVMFQKRKNPTKPPSMHEDRQKLFFCIIKYLWGLLLVAYDELQKLCSREECKTRRALSVASVDEKMQNFVCEHIRLVAKGKGSVN